MKITTLQASIPTYSRDFILCEPCGMDMTEVFSELIQQETGDTQTDAGFSKLGENSDEIVPPCKREFKRLEPNRNQPTITPGRQPTPTVEALSALTITGNIVPRQWLGHLRLPSGHADTIAALVLGELVYWFRPNQKGERKFAADTLQKSYRDLAESLFLTRCQVKDAIARLEVAGLIKREFRNVQIAGRTISNVMHVHLSSANLAALTSNVVPTPTHVLAGDIPRFDEGGVTAQGGMPCAKASGIYTEHIGEHASDHAAEHNKKEEENPAGRADLFSFVSDDGGTPEGSNSSAMVLAAVEDMFDGDSLVPDTIAKFSKLARDGRLTAASVCAMSAARRIFLNDPYSWSRRAFSPHTPEKLLEKLRWSLDGAATILDEARSAAEATKQAKLAAGYAAHLNSIPMMETAPEVITTAILEAQAQEGIDADNYEAQLEQQKRDAKIRAELEAAEYPLLD